jgi:hypothetical protein
MFFPLQYHSAIKCTISQLQIMYSPKFQSYKSKDKMVTETIAFSNSTVTLTLYPVSATFCQPNARSHCSIALNTQLYTNKVATVWQMSSTKSHARTVMHDGAAGMFTALSLPSWSSLAHDVHVYRCTCCPQTAATFMVKPRQSANGVSHTLDIIDESLTFGRRKKCVSLPSGMGAVWPWGRTWSFNTTNLADLKAGRCVPEHYKGRIIELQYRNSLCPPNLKSSYPAEKLIIM